MIPYHPEIGTVVICDFHGFIPPEMVKRRPAIVVSPRFRNRNELCTIVPLSTTPPNPVMPYHCRIIFDEPLPPPYDSSFQWVKGDMLATVSFRRLFLPRAGKDDKGKREYILKVISGGDFRRVRECILNGLALSSLTRFL